MSIALAVVLTLLLCSVLGLLIHYLRHRRAKAPHDVEDPAKCGVPLAHDLREVQRSQVPPRVVGGRDVEMVNREEPESRRRGWQAEHDERMRRERERGGMVEVDLREGGGREREREIERERDTERRRGGYWWGGALAAAAVVA